MKTFLKAIVLGTAPAAIFTGMLDSLSTDNVAMAGGGSKPTTPSDDATTAAGTAPATRASTQPTTQTAPPAHGAAAWPDFGDKQICVFIHSLHVVVHCEAIRDSRLRRYADENICKGARGWDSPSRYRGGIACGRFACCARRDTAIDTSGNPTFNPARTDAAAGIPRWYDWWQARLIDRKSFRERRRCFEDRL